MVRHYLLSATGRDRPGIVAAVAHLLLQLQCNLEDSSMMRLGSEFAMFLIFSRRAALPAQKFQTMSQRLEREFGLAIGLKPLQKRDARFVPPQSETALIAVHGPDRPGIVYRVTNLLARHRFNITDLSTHRTTSGKRPGYILFIEGEPPRADRRRSLQKQLQALEKRLRTRITFRLLQSAPL
jgi:glycine cleavage system transcriptional repressor